jgi:pyruvate-formate lyase-activating enzyme
MNPLYFMVAERAQHRCEYCHAPESIFNIVMEVEHIIPVAKGGSDSIESGEIFPLTVIGQATVTGLKMNSRAQLVARKFWIQLGLFP